MQFGSGYGSQTVLMPNEAQDNVSRSDELRAKSQLATATLPDEIAMSGNKRQMSDLALVDAKSTSLAKNTGTQQELVANAAALATTPEEWDEAMQDLVDKGVPLASQFIGRFSEQLKGRVTNAFSAATPSSALAAMQSDNPTGAGGAQSGLGDVAGGAGAGVSSGAEQSPFAAQINALPAPAVKALYDKTEVIRNAIQAVAQSQNPAAEWDKQAQAMGHPEWVGHYSPQQLQQLAQQTMPLSNYLRGRITREDMGAPEAKPAPKVDNVGGTLYAIDTTDPQHPKATPLTPQGKSVLVGTDPDTGVGVYYDPTTGKETKGSVKLAAKPGNGAGGGRGGNSVFALKQAAWLQVHPGDTQGALDYAGSLKGKNLSGEQIQMAATTAAARELANLALAGTPPPDGQAFLTARTAEIAQDIAARGPTATTTEAAPAGSIPQRALQLLKDGKPHRFQNGQTWQIKNGKPVRVS